jgi:predicted unusual protein kinase regulating ubiquinone biosynthesis (AarF/ABC1/UbiB family)
MDLAEAQRAEQDLKNTWAEVISRFSFGSFRHANLLHADPHPGNFRFNTDGTVGFVDFGCVKVLPEKQRRLLIASNRAVIERRKEDLRDLMMQMGFLTADSDLTNDELYEWQSQVIYETAVMPQPVTVTPEAVRRVIDALFDLRDANHPMARMNAPDDFVFLARVQLAVHSVLAALRATAHARAIVDDMDGVAEPITELGKLHHAWVRERGLPSALDHHDHP